ncbi:MAG: pyrroline-5-carboxylate reductase [Syntrophomonadaceae bacterium]|nr:pyrroline-5-carboxylate reductase [Syntrophomonadaceae bacterium]
MTEKPGLGIIGCGQMGKALFQGLIKQEMELGKIAVFDIDHTRSAELARQTKTARAADSAVSLAEAVDVIIVAVKPHQVALILQEIRPALRRNQILISVAAGIPLEVLQAEAGPDIPVVRVMPNVPSLVGQGALGISFSLSVNETQKALIIELFEALGLVEEVPEALMDAVTALSGSGPAFIFLVAEALCDGAVSVGMPRDMARRLTDQTILGSAAMLQQTGEHPAVLRERITSPGGTTIAGLGALERGGTRGIFYDAVKEAFMRSQQIKSQQ